VQDSFKWVVRICIGLLGGCAAPSHVVLLDGLADESARIDAIMASRKPVVAVALVGATDEERIDYEMKPEVYGPDTPGAQGIALAWDADPLAPEPAELAAPAVRPRSMPLRFQRNPWWTGQPAASTPPPPAPVSGGSGHSPPPAPGPRGPSSHSNHH
jgi:hypothetical protein